MQVVACPNFASREVIFVSRETKNVSCGARFDVIKYLDPTAAAPAGEDETADTPRPSFKLGCIMLCFRVCSPAFGARCIMIAYMYYHTHNDDCASSQNTGRVLRRCNSLKRPILAHTRRSDMGISVAQL